MTPSPTSFVQAPSWGDHISSILDLLFFTFLAVGTTDLVMRERLVYAILVVREGMRHGDQG